MSENKDATLSSTAPTRTGQSVDTVSTLSRTRKPDRQHENFRQHNVRFLQEQNKEATRALEKMEEERDVALQMVQQWEEKKFEIQQEYRTKQQELDDATEKVSVSAAEVQILDNQVATMTEKNRQLLELLEQEEKTKKDVEAKARELRDDKDELQNISDLYDKVKETGNQQLAAVYTEISKYQEELRNERNANEQLKEAEANFSAQAQVDVEELEKKLSDSKDKNVQYLQQIQHNEVHEHRLSENIQRLKTTLEELTVQKKGIKMQLDMDVEGRDRWLQSKAEVERRKETLQKTADALRQSLRDAEEHNRKMQDESKTGADEFRQLGDKVYALMDQLRQNQMELRKQEHAGKDKQKTIEDLEKKSVVLQQSLQVEVDAKLTAEAEARNAAQLSALLQKKNKMLEDAFQLALKAQEKVERRLQELNDKATALTTQNEYLGNRINGNEEDKGALRYELRRTEDELRQANAMNTQLAHQHTEIEDKFNAMEAERESSKAELDYIRREDMLDESGRTKPILLESESKLIERLQINEFLYTAQQARNPVPMLVEKVSHILELLHTAHTQADMYLQDLQRSNSMLSALRDKNMQLYERVQMCETWKMRALLRIASNEFEIRESVKGVHKARNRDNHVLFLDGLQYGNKELQELHKLISKYGKEESVKEIRLQDNQLDRNTVSSICALLELCPYLTKLDLKRNKLDESAVSGIQSYIERIPGVTSITRDPASGDLRVKSGNMIRLVVALEEQSPPDPNAPPGDDDLEGDPYGQGADAFLASAAGVTAQTKLQGPDVLGASAVAGGAARTLMPPQRTGLGESKSEALLPRIGSASQLSPAGSGAAAARARTPLGARR